MRRHALTGIAFVLLLASPALADNGYIESIAMPDGLTYVGSETCLDCHEEVAEFYAATSHSLENNLIVPGTAIGGCESCHGPGSLHVEEEGEGFIIGSELYAEFGDTQRLAMCTQCHATQSTHWAGGPHDGADISCNDCHADQVHFGGQALPSSQFRNPSEFCLQCHAEQTSDFRLPFRHRVLENQVACGDCHDPHANMDATRMNGMNDTCLGCHQEMAGPFVFEHDGVSGEDCTVCHKPHGSNHDKLLITEGNTLCVQCHFDTEFNSADGWNQGSTSHSGFTGSEGRCFDCHSEVHGSNVSPNFMDQ